MAVKTRTVYCRTCNAKRLAQGPAPNHILHLLLAVVTAGFWIPVWLLVSLFSSGRFHCTHCGNRV